jgi:uncharacterized protein (DUF1499 family)
MSLLSKLGKRWEPADPSRLGIRDGRLAPCPRKPNCVSSQAERPEQRVEPIALGEEPAAGWEAAREILSRWSRTRIVVEEEGYLRAECRSLLGFVDDLELLLDREAGVLHLRSASRLGYQDFGVNRARVERLREELGAARK